MLANIPAIDQIIRLALDLKNLKLREIIKPIKAPQPSDIVISIKGFKIVL